MKIRGNAHHVAEKYLQLARDAHTSGDPVAAENYLQHAEHYFRLIAAAQAAQLQAQNGAGRSPGELDADEGDDDDDGGVLDRFASPVERAPVPYVPPQQPYVPQPNVGGPYGYGDRQPAIDNDRPNQPDRNGFQPRGDRPMNRNQDRGPRPDRPFQDRQDHRDGRGPNDGRQREFRPYREPPVPRDAPPPMPIDPPQPVTLPSFITAAPRIVASQDDLEPSLPSATENAAEASGAPEPSSAFAEEPPEGRFPGRGRRRRTRSPYGFHAESPRDDAQPTPTGPDQAPVSE